MIGRIAALLSDRNDFLVACHRSPDGDAIGSLTGLGRIMERLSKRFTLFCPDPPPSYFRFLHLTDRISTTLASDFRAEVAFAVDVADPALLGEGFPAKDRIETLVVIDHHLRFTPFGDLVWRDAKMAAVGVQIYHLARHMDLFPDRKLAEAIWCSIYTDTGGFRYSGTNGDALRICADLLDQGIDPWEMAIRIYESNPASRVRLLSRVLDTLELSDGGHVAMIVVTRDLLKETGLDESMLDTFINHARGIQGVEVAVQLTQKKNNRWKIGLRSKGTLDVSRLAARFGGGGHRNAAGCSLEGSYETVRDTVLAAADDLVQKKEQCPALPES